ncbi:uncharacterized protein LOC117122281 [Anneissia japonica]|uniref:uncharacterized protein LOC117122281 n=1 Tax=Anneissia japonica TaxID=1529436 RepID=UPI0014254C61|nr:uncharacterized protein LOC117122281 [Anneissia japonica]XP_033123716.1 uncharacterized protein LOC117122281 [Anneissia japonica]
MYGNVIQHPGNTDVRTNRVHPVEEDNSKTSTVTRADHPLYSQLKNYMFFMKLGGVFHDPPFADVGKLESAFWKSWHAIVSLLSVFNFVRYIPEIWKPDFYPGLIYTEIIMSAFFFHCMCIIIAFYVMCSKMSGFLAFFEHNQKYCNSIDSRTLRCVPGKKQTKVEVNIAQAITVVCTAACLAILLVFALVFETPDYHSQSAPWTSTASLVITLTIGTLIANAFMSYTFFFCLVCRYLKKQFNLLAKTFSEMLIEYENGRGEFVDEQLYVSIRKQHNHLCDSVVKADDCFSVFILSVCSTQIPLIIFLAYQCLFSPGDISEKFGYIFWLMINCGCVCLVTIHAALLNSEIHDFNNKVYRLTAFSTMPCNNRLIPIHILFLSRLNGPPVGFSVFGLITINKEVLVTLVGMTFTYFTLLVQFE